MPRASAWLWVGMLSLTVFGSVARAADRATMVRESYKEAFGADANADEIKYWSGRGDWTTKEQLWGFHKQWLKSSGEARTKAVRAAYTDARLPAPNDTVLRYWTDDLAQNPRPVRVMTNDISAWTTKRASLISDAYQSALGRPADANEVAYWSTRTDWKGYGGLVELHRQWIRGNDAGVNMVIANSYVNVFRRQPNNDERNYWFNPVKQNGYTAAQLQAAHADWFNKTLRKLAEDPAVMKALNAQGVTFDVNGALVKIEGSVMTGNTITPLAAGPGKAAAPIVAGGGGNLLGKGGAGIVAAGGGNVIAPPGGYLLGKGGAGIVAAGGGNFIGTGVGSFTTPAVRQ